MRRLWFKEEMKDAILEGRKTATTRYKQLPIGMIKAVSGSRFDAEPFAILDIVTNFKTTWQDVTSRRNRAEGFRTPYDMVTFLKEQKLVKGTLEDKVFFHRFNLHSTIAPATKATSSDHEQLRNVSQFTKDI